MRLLSGKEPQFFSETTGKSFCMRLLRLPGRSLTPISIPGILTVRWSGPLSAILSKRKRAPEQCLPPCVKTEGGFIYHREVFADPINSGGSPMKQVRMREVRMVLAVIACIAGIAAASSVSAKPEGPRITAQQKAASDQAMQAGLADLQAASSAMQSGNAGQIGADLQGAITAMQQARPIYRGHREKSIRAADAALKALQGNRKRAAQRVARLVARGILDAQAALSTN
jgi:hypothetical protein